MERRTSETIRAELRAAEKELAELVRPEDTFKTWNAAVQLEESFEEQEARADFVKKLDEYYDRLGKLELDIWLLRRELLSMGTI